MRSRWARALNRRRTIAASLTHFATVPLFLQNTAAIATIPRHAAAILARAMQLEICDAPVLMGRFDVFAVGRQDTVGDEGRAWLKEQVAACAGAVLCPP